MLKGARVVTASETDAGGRWAEARIKLLTGGDPITANFMYKDHFTYMPAFKPLFAGNHRPALSNVDEAMRRRFVMIPFVRKPVQVDAQLEQKLAAELPRIMTWAVEGCLDWQANGLMRPPAVREATDDYFADQDVLGRWIAEFCDVGPDQFDTPTTLYRSWTSYARDNAEEAVTPRTFGDMLEKRGFQRKKSSGIRVHRGIGLKPSTRLDL